VDQYLYLFTIKFRKDLQRKLGLKLPTLFASLPSEIVDDQVYSFIAQLFAKCCKDV